MVMEQLTSAMDVVALPVDDDDDDDDAPATTKTTTTTTNGESSSASPPLFLCQSSSLLSNPADHPIRPYDTLGPPSEPVPFPQPRYFYGKRANVLCYNPDTDQHEIVQNVLFRDFSRSAIGSSSSNNSSLTGSNSSSFRRKDDAADCRVKEAYWVIPYKQRIKTIMGHVEICIVLERCLRQNDDDSFENSDSEADCHTDDDDDEDEEDIVFQWTKRRVAVKVNYCDRMDRLKNRHAEDPLKEIAAMQLIGDEHPNVLGCREVLFDGKNLNVVMRYCESGDLFQLLQDCQAFREEGECPGLTEGQARYWFRQIMAGVKHLHSVGICHRDLSPENVMIDRDDSLIIDMGMCLRVPYCVSESNTQVMDIETAREATPQPQRCLFHPQGACGKLPYMSPEIYKNRTSFDGSAADVWTAGTILFCMVTGNRSYQRPHASDPQFYWMSRGLLQLLADWNVKLSPEGEHLLQNMLQVKPRLRLTVDEVMNHPWFSLPEEPMQLGGGAR